MVFRPVAEVLGPKDIAGWIMRYLALFLGVISLVLIYDLAENRRFLGDIGAVMNSVVRLGLPSTILLSLCMAWVIQMRYRMFAEAGADAQTGLLQRHVFLARAETKLEKHAALLLLDIDSLAKLNLGHGLAVGDRALMALAMRIREVAGKGGVAGRTDGATFALLLPSVPMSDARQIAEGLSEGIQVTTGDRQVTVTISVGLVAATPEKGLALALAAAEEALLRAKARGPAQVNLSDGHIAARPALKLARA